MTTSGVQTFSQTRDQLIYDAYQLIGVYGIGRTISAEDLNLADRFLNKMIKAWATKGLHLWSKEEGVLFLTPSTSSFILGSSGRCTSVNDLRMHTVATAASSGATTITLDSTSNIIASDVIGFVQDDKTIHWSTVSSKTTSTVTISDITTDDISVDAIVYVYTNTIYKPLRILDARYITRTGDTDNFERPLTAVAYQTYFDIPVKNTASIPVQYTYVPDLTSGKFYLWPQPSDGSARIQFTYERMLEDLTQANDDFDFPSEWLEALTYQLALRLSIPFGKSQKHKDLLPIASVMLQDLLNWDTEIVEVCFQPDEGY